MKETKIGILGGGQLGRMLIQDALNYGLHLSTLDPDPKAPCAQISDFTNGDFRDYETVKSFAKGKTHLSIEIEDVNTKALREAEKDGVKVFPKPSIIEIIQDKVQQKRFYMENNFPTALGMTLNSKEDIQNIDQSYFPGFFKFAKGGYDGKGVVAVNKKEELEGLVEKGPGLLEVKADIERELALITVRNEDGDVNVFPPVEMVFDPKLNLVDYLLSPALLRPEIARQARQLAFKLTNELGIVGVLAIEMFYTKNGELLINEVAPRPHNSGHATIEGSTSSQFDQLLRALLGLPLGELNNKGYSAMVNIIGPDEGTGTPVYEGMYDLLNMGGVYPHIYGKAETRPGRKLGHLTLCADTRDELFKKIQKVKELFKVSVA